MRSIAVVVLLVLAACTSIPPAPSTGCSGLTYCEDKTIIAEHRGLSAKYTVQRALQTTLIGGKPVEAGEFPASVYARSNEGACSATLVGERVLFMASHCMDEGESVAFTAHANNYRATCAHHPGYVKDDTADWALCLVDRPVTGVPFEVFGINEELKLKQEVTLSGYGCINKGGGGGNDGIFRIGKATIQGLPSNNTFDVVTLGGAAVCYGDSGGAGYVTYPDGSRYIFGVNSRGNIETVSYLPAVYSKSFVDWAKTWAKNSNNVRICGIHSDALFCRTGGGSPQADGKFEVSGPAACIRGVVQPDFIEKKTQIMDTIQKSLDQL